MGCECLKSCQSSFTLKYIKANGCPFKIPGDCVYYSGPEIPDADIQPLDDFNTVVQKLKAWIDSLAGYVAPTTTTTTSSTTTTTTT